MPAQTPPGGLSLSGPVVIAFAEKVFGAKERMRIPMPDGTIAHCELQIADSVLMVGEAGDEWPATTTTVDVYIDDVDGVYNRALEAGSTSIMELEDRFYGDRAAGFRDPFGNTWNTAPHVEDVPGDEMNRRMEEAMKTMQ